MSVMVDWQIAEQAQKGLVIPYEETMVNPASLDLRWGGTILAPDHSIDGPITLDMMRLGIGRELFQILDQPKAYLVPGMFYLLGTLETLTLPDNWAGQLKLKSTLARMGLMMTGAGWFDPGYSGAATIAVTNVAPWVIEIKRDEPIAQMVFYAGELPANIYAGRYGGTQAPQAPR